ncbi:MAG: preprotein translocase subunit SecA, partial [Stecheria intestinalis]|nr:preprotein translocase subunit SecA [Stecheria intestinalis]
KKLAGMTGTASTEADEFSEIYGLQIVSIPTNKPRARKDLPDSVYKTVNGKYKAVIDQVAECHAKGQPVLVGTVSVEKSEALSKLLKQRGIAHNVLNAKQHEREAEIVAQAGKQGAVTIATNMAGRGTDIMLGGNVTYMAKAALRKELSQKLSADLAAARDEYEHAKARAKAQGTELPTPPDAVFDARMELLMTECDGHADTDNAEVLAARKRFDELVAQFEPQVKKEAEAVREAGGLFIIGTERHESRRIDNQLRGRSGRQGDPGESRFYVSVQDDLMVRFGSERLESLFKSLGDEAVESKTITNAISSAQKRVEGVNFDARKTLLQYDDVLRQQREVMYDQRNFILDNEDVHSIIQQMFSRVISDTVGAYVDPESRSGELHIPELLEALNKLGFRDLITEADLKGKTAEEASALINDRAWKNYDEKIDPVRPQIRQFEREMSLKVIDRAWVNHIDTMSKLRDGIGLRSYAQDNPLQAYVSEGYQLFQNMMHDIAQEIVAYCMNLKVVVRQPETKQA